MRRCSSFVASASCAREFTPQALGSVIARQRQHRTASTAANLQHVGQIELALGIVVANLGQRVEQSTRVKAVEPGVAFAQSRLFGRCVLLLHDARHRASLVAHDAPVPERIVQFHGQHHHGSVIALARLDQLRNRSGRDKRAVARQHHQRAVEVGKRVRAHQNRARRAVLLALHNGLRIALDQRNHLLASMPHHGNHAVHASFAGRVHHPANQRFSQHLVGNLGLLGLHAGARTRS